MALRSMEEARARRDEQHDLYNRLEAEGLELKRRKLQGGADGGAGGAGRGAGGAGGSGGATGGGGGDGGGRDAGEEAAREAWSRWAEQPEMSLTAVTAQYPGGEPDANGGVRDEARAAPDSADLAEEEALPSGWTSAIDERYGAHYYFHSESGGTQWERPTTVSEL